MGSELISEDLPFYGSLKKLKSAFLEKGMYLLLFYVDLY